MAHGQLKKAEIFNKMQAGFLVIRYYFYWPVKS